MKRIAMMFVTVAALFTFAGCGTSEGIDDGGDNTNAPATHYTFYQDLPDGSEVMCVWAKSGYGGGLSCDWDRVDHNGN